jgi:hypothetical protein
LLSYPVCGAGFIAGAPYSSQAEPCSLAILESRTDADAPTNKFEARRALGIGKAVKQADQFFGDLDIQPDFGHRTTPGSRVAVA